MQTPMLGMSSTPRYMCKDMMLKLFEVAKLSHRLIELYIGLI